jgi:hypothetical protein
LKCKPCIPENVTPTIDPRALCVGEVIDKYQKLQTVRNFLCDVNVLSLSQGLSALMTFVTRNALQRKNLYLKNS